MSISAMTNVAVARKSDTKTNDGVPPTNDGIVASTAGTPESRQGMGGAMQVIVTYIPTEVLALYTSVATAIQATDLTQSKSIAGNPAWIAFFICLIMTPLIVWLVYAGKVKLASGGLPFHPTQWPKWEMFAATLAFAAWAYSMPNSPFRFLDGFYSPGIAAFVLPTSATFLGFMAPLFQRPQNP